MIAEQPSSLRPAWLRPVEPACAAIAALLHPHAEVVVHDLASDRIVAIWNATSGRGPGDPSLLDELPASWESAPVQGPYAKIAVDGGPQSAVSAIVRDAAGTPRGLLCVNLDRSPLERAARLLDDLFAPRDPRPRELFDRDWREQIALEVDAFCREEGVDRARLPRDRRLALVGRLDAQGLFETRNAAQHAATALGVSRATVYALLKESRE